MAIVKARVAQCSEWTSPDGKVNITPARIQNWVKEHTSLRDHWDFPVTWGHLSTALPENKLANPTDEETRRRALSNAGYVKQLTPLPDGGMEAVMDVPGVELVDGKLSAMMKDASGNSVRNAIKDVSIAFGPWRDGKGVVHDDVVKHIALTPLPVISGQKGFTALSTTDAAKQKETVVEFPLDHKTIRFATDDEFDKVSKVAKAKAADTDGDGVPDAVDPTPDLLTPDAVPDPVDPAQAQFDAAKALLNEMGVPLPAETNVENFLEHLNVALTVLKGRLKMEAAAKTDEPVVPVATTTPAPQPQFMMSTADMTPREIKLATRLHEDRREKRLAKIEKIKKLSLRPEAVEQLKEGAGDTRLALDADCNLADEEIDRLLAFLEKSVLRNPFTTRLATAPAPGNPQDDAPKMVVVNGVEMTEAAAQQVNRMAALSGNGNGKK